MAYKYIKQDAPHFISLGAGVQSSAMALMAAHGEITPAPKAAVFSDTQAEPPVVYEWLDYLETEIQKAPYPFPVYRVTFGNLEEDIFKVRKIKREGSRFPVGTTYLPTTIPLYGYNEKGKPSAILRRGCTKDYKIQPIYKEIRRIVRTLQYKKTNGVSVWLGITTDEVQRLSDSKEAWITNRFPLYDLNMSRASCVEWMKVRGFESPPRSACYFCPFHTNREWLRMKTENSDLFQKAVEFERRLQKHYRQHHKISQMKEIYLTQSRVPLDEVDFTPIYNKQTDSGMLDECTGFCGV